MRSTRSWQTVAAATVLVATAAVAAPAVASADDGEIVVEAGESIQAAIDAAEPGTTIVVRGDHVENVWVNKDGISLVGQDGATLTQPAESAFAPCDFFAPPGASTTVCVYPPTEEFPVPAEQKLSGFSISGFEITNPGWDAVGVIGANDVRVSRNSMTSGCSGVWLLFVDDFTVDRNDVTGDNDCNGIDASASSNGVVTRNTATDNGLNGIAINDSSDVIVSRNTATGNCQGIGVFDNPDPSDLPADNVTITHNVANANNTVCYPFDPPGSQQFPIGGAGIIVGGATGTVITRNVANDNIVDGFTLSAGGIFVTDFPGEDPAGPPFSVATNTTLDRNTAFGNSSIVGPADVRVQTIGSFASISRNTCGVSTPDASWCTD